MRVPSTARAPDAHGCALGRGAGDGHFAPEFYLRCLASSRLKAADNPLYSSAAACGPPSVVPT